MTVYAPKTQYRLFMKDIAGITDFPTFMAKVEAIWGLDGFLSEFHESGIFNTVISDTAPTDKMSIWIDPNNPSTSANSIVKMHNGSEWVNANWNLFIKSIKDYLGEFNVKLWGAAGDGSYDDFDICQMLASTLSFLTSVSDGGQTAVVGQNLIFPHGSYNFNNKTLILPNQVDPVVNLGGNSIIKNGGFYWETTYGNKVQGFEFVNPPSKYGNVTGLTNTSPVRVTVNSHPFNDNDFVRFRGVGGSHEINGRGYIVTRIDDDVIELNDSDGTSWGTYTSSGEARQGAAIEFGTNNVSRSRFTVEDCGCYGQGGDRQAFVISRGYEKSRSTSLVLTNNNVAHIDRIAHSNCDNFIINGGFYWQNSHLEAPFYSRGLTNVNGGVFVPRDTDNAAHWWDWDVGKEPSGANAFISSGSRWSGEDGGITVLRTLASGSPLTTSLNPTSITFDTCYIAALKGGRSDSKGSVVMLGRGNSTTGAAWVPNSIEFRNCNANLFTDSYLVQTENDGADVEFNDGMRFQITYDDASSISKDVLGQEPLPSNLTKYMSKQTRLNRINRTQILDTSESRNPNYLKGNKIIIKSAGARVFESIANMMPGENLLILIPDELQDEYRILHDAAGIGETNVNLNDGLDFNPSLNGSPASIHLVMGDDGELYEISRSNNV